MRSSNGNVMLGVSIIVIGVLFYLEGRNEFVAEFGKYWSVLLIFLGGVSWATQGRKPSFSNLLVITMGVLFPIGTLYRLDPRQMFWAAMFIFIGLKLTFRPRVRSKYLR